MTVPYLIDFKPYVYTGEKCQSIDDMISVSLLQRVPISNISYDIGSSDDINLPVAIKNITNNIDLEITVSVNKNIFVIDNQENVESKTVILPAGLIERFVFTLNKNSLNQTVRTFNSNITITVKNITNGGIVTKNVSTSSFNVNFLDETIFVSE